MAAAPLEGGTSLPAERSVDRSPELPADAIEVGRVLGAWGIKGWIKVQAFASDPKALFASKRWHLQAPEAGAVKKPISVGGAVTPALLKVILAKEHGDVIVAQVQDVDSRNAAEALRGARIFVGRSSFPTAGPDEYYWIDLLGLDVLNRAGDRLGTVAGLLDTGPHSVLRVAPYPGAADAEERLIPFVATYVDDVSLAERRIVVDWGLDY